MKYIVKKGKPLFGELAQLYNRVQVVHKKARRVAKRLGSEIFWDQRDSLAGGIDAIHFDKKPQGWRKAGESWQHMYYPTVTNKEVNNIITALPTIEFSELNDILKYLPEGLADESGRIIRCPDVYCYKEYILVAVHERSAYVPHPDLEEIVVSLYNSLKK